MKNLQINTSPIGTQEYNLGEKVGEDIYIYGTYKATNINLFFKDSNISYPCFFRWVNNSEIGLWLEDWCFTLNSGIGKFDYYISTPISSYREGPAYITENTDLILSTHYVSEGDKYKFTLISNLLQDPDTTSIVPVGDLDSNLLSGEIILRVASLDGKQIIKDINLGSSNDSFTDLAIDSISLEKGILNIIFKD